MAKGEVDAQQELEDAFEARDLDGFKRAITRGAQPNLSSKKDEDNQMTIFEKALSTKGCHQFIEACLDAGCDPNYVNPKLNKAAIHYTIDPGIGSASHYNASNLHELVNRPNSKVDVDRKYEGETALSRLIKSLEVKNPPDCCYAIRLLLKKGASPNIVDSDGKTLMQHVLLNENISQSTRANLISKMLRALLKEHITKHTENALEAVLATLETNSPQENEYLVELAVEAGSWSTALKLLKSKFLKLVPKSPTLLKIMIKQVQLKPLINYVQSNEYQECLLQLLMVQRLYINDFDDEHKTPLHYAVLYRNEVAIRVLLRVGARLGVRNDKNRLLIEDMDAKLLEEHFDYCITGRGEKTNHEDYELNMNFLNMTNENNELDIAPIVCMARSKELCPLLTHPLITCFLKLKWRRLIAIFSIHFIINIILTLILWIHICLRFSDRHNNGFPEMFVNVVFQVLIGYLLIVKVISFLIVKHWRSLIDFILIFMLILTNIECGDDIQRIITVFAIMLMSTKLMNLIGALPVPFISVHMLMLRQVASTFAKSLLQYSMLLFSFSLCFYVLFSKQSPTDSANSTNSANLTGSANSTDNDFSLSFAKFDLSLMKTLVMFNGENDKIETNGYFSSFVMIIFMFMVMVLTNLLGGLAVGDTQTILAQAELNAAICRANVLYSYEGLLDGNSPGLKRLLRIFKKLMRIPAESTYSYVSIFPNQKNRAEVCSQRHNNPSIVGLANKVNDTFGVVFAVGALGSESVMDEEALNLRLNAEVDENEVTFFYKNIKIEIHTVARALNIIKEREGKKVDEQREEFIEQRREDMRMLLKEIKNQLDIKNPAN